MRTAKIVPIVCAMTSIFVGFVVFSVLGFMAHRLGTTVDKVTAAGEWEERSWAGVYFSLRVWVSVSTRVCVRMTASICVFGYV